LSKGGQTNAILSDGVGCATGVAATAVQRTQGVVVCKEISVSVSASVSGDSHANAIYDPRTKGCGENGDNHAASSSTTAMATLYHNLGCIINDDNGKPLASVNGLSEQPLDVDKISPTYTTSRPIILMSNAGLCTPAGSGRGRETDRCNEKSNGSSVINGRVNWVTEGVTANANIGVVERKTEEDDINEKGQENVAVLAAAIRDITVNQMTLRSWFEKTK